MTTTLATDVITHLQTLIAYGCIALQPFTVVVTKQKEVQKIEYAQKEAARQQKCEAAATDLDTALKAYEKGNK